MDYKIELMALDKDFNIIGLLRYVNLQWTRKWYECGTFSVQIPVDQYDKDFRYIYTKDRNELGVISQLNYIDDGSSKLLALSGYFLENMLNSRTAYKRPYTGATNITTTNNWTSKTGTAEDVAHAYFEAFKDLAFTYNSKSYSLEMDVEEATSQGRGDEVTSERDGSQLGDKLHTILKESEMSYRIAYDYETNTKTFECVKGKDLTADNEDLNNPVVFSTLYGNIANANIVWSNSDLFNVATAENTYTANSIEATAVYAVTNMEDGDDASIINLDTDSRLDDYSSATAFVNAILADGYEKLLEHTATMSFDFDAIIGSYEYLTDFDLGDKVSIEIPEIGISTDAILTECVEVIKNGTWTMTMSFDY